MSEGEGANMTNNLTKNVRGVRVSFWAVMHVAEEYARVHPSVVHLTYTSRR